MAGIGCICKDLYVALQIWATANATAGCRLSSVSDLTLPSVLVLTQLPAGWDSWAGTCPCSGWAVAGASREGGATGPLLLQLSSGCWSWWLPVPSNTSPTLLCPLSFSGCSPQSHPLRCRLSQSSRQCWTRPVPGGSRCKEQKSLTWDNLRQRAWRKKGEGKITFKIIDICHYSDSRYIIF